jgi:hypothetical protein
LSTGCRNWNNALEAASRGAMGVAVRMAVLEALARHLPNG